VPKHITELDNTKLLEKVEILSATIRILFGESICHVKCGWY